VTVVKEFHKKGDRTQRFRIKIDEHAEDPWQEFDHVTRVYHCHPRYKFDEETRGDQESIHEEAKRVESAGGAVLPLYLFEHSGSRLSTEPFGCPWDSGQIGFAVIRKEVIDTEFNGSKELAESCIRAEIKLLDSYWAGEVYGWQYVQLSKCQCCEQESEEVEDSCWGFYGSDFDQMMQDAGLVAEEWEEV
jgi:hypothetical protein